MKVLCMLIGYSGHVVYHVLLPCSEFTVSAIKRSQLCYLVSSRLLFSPNTTETETQNMKINRKQVEKYIFRVVGRQMAMF